MSFHSFAFAQVGQNDLRISQINVRFSAGYQQRLDEILAATQAQLNIEQGKLDEARKRRKSVSRAMQKLIVKVNKLTKQKEFIESELINIPSEILERLENELSEIEQGSRDATLNIQIGSFIASKKKQVLWPTIHNTMAGSAIVIDNETNEIIMSFIATDIDTSQYSADTASFIEGMAIGAGGLAGFMIVGLFSSHGGRTDLIEDFAKSVLSTIYLAE